MKSFSVQPAMSMTVQTQLGRSDRGVIHQRFLAGVRLEFLRLARIAFLEFPAQSAFVRILELLLGILGFLEVEEFEGVLHAGLVGLVFRTFGAGQLERLHQFDAFHGLVLGAKIGEMMLGQDGNHQKTAVGHGLVVGQTFVLIGVEPKAERDENDDAGPEQESALAFEARLAEQLFEGAIRHIENDN